MLVGLVEGFRGPYLCGWASAGPASANCTIEVSDQNGRVIHRGRAARNLSLRGNVGFRIPVGYMRQPGLLHVRADGVELPGSPIGVGPGLYDGGLEVEAGVIHGWVSERSGAAAVPLVRIHDHDGALVGEAQAAPQRLPDDDPLFTPARFSCRIADSYIGRPEVGLRAYVGAYLFAQTTCSLPVDGFLDVLTPDRCSGWLFSPHAPDRILTLQVRVNGRLVASGCCDLPRPDLQGRYPANERAWVSGFDIALDRPCADVPDLALVSLRLANSSEELFGGPHVVGYRQSLVRALRNVATLANNPAYQPSLPERALLQAAIAGYIQTVRGAATSLVACHSGRDAPPVPRLTVVIPVYRDVAVTRRCIASVLAFRNAATDHVVIVNDHSPDGPEMDLMLREFADQPGVTVLDNRSNLGFVRSVNRALRFCRAGDVLLLNSDTEVFRGVIDELWSVAHAQPDVGTATALSNNATVFSYPHPEQRVDALPDVTWGEIARLALSHNAGLAVPVPTAHGFCMLIRRDLLDRAGLFDEAFGRGYGEENDFCQRGADLGFRHVAAAGAFVEHHETVSFAADKPSLLRHNLGVLAGRYPEYTPTIMQWERDDPLRRARWALDAARLQRLGERGRRFALVVSNPLSGGTARAIADIEAAHGYDGATRLTLCCREDGSVELVADDPPLRSVFSGEEGEAAFTLLDEAPVETVFIHQVLGFTADFIARLCAFLAGRHAVFYVHDYYALCPRVTMINALGEFCDAAEAARCASCLQLGGAHEASRLDGLSPREHREALGALLDACARVVAPSASAARYVGRVFPSQPLEVVPHPERGKAVPAACDNGREVVLLGAIGPHKGSQTLLDLARRARLERPDLHFTVIGYTNLDVALDAVGNVRVTGPYQDQDLPDLVRAARARLALFLHGWPETYSYTLSEALRLGLYPLVPDIGAPAERVRSLGVGRVYPFPINTGQLLDVIHECLQMASPRPARPTAPQGGALARPAARRRRALAG